MRLRTFTAATVAEAMALVRAHFGRDAVIVSTEPAAEGGCRVTAAIEEDDDQLYAGSLAAQPDPLEAIAAALAGHGVPLGLAQHLGSLALDGLDEDAASALAGALAVHFRFAALELGPASRILLVGPPGAGKTVTAAKLAARQVLMRRPVRLISTDTARAGGVEQLAALTRILALPLACADSPAALAREVAALPGAVIIDSAGFNPYRAAERRDIGALAAAAQAEPVLVLPAGTDSAEAIEIAASCSELGCRRFIATRLDLARRLGSVLAAAADSDLAFAEVGIAPDIADGLCPLTPLGLARLLLPDMAAAGAAAPTPEIFDRGARP